MQAKAVAKYIRISPRKARQVIDLIRGKNCAEAIAILKFIPHKATESISKVLNSAIANAEHNYEMDGDKLYVKEAFVDGGPSFKRIMPRAMGRADLIKKRTSHITVVVDERQEKEGAKTAEDKSVRKETKPVKKAAPKKTTQAAKKPAASAKKAAPKAKTEAKPKNAESKTAESKAKKAEKAKEGGK